MGILQFNRRRKCLGRVVGIGDFRGIDLTRVWLTREGVCFLRVNLVQDSGFCGAWKLIELVDLALCWGVSHRGGSVGGKDRNGGEKHHRQTNA